MSAVPSPSEFAQPPDAVTIWLHNHNVLPKLGMLCFAAAIVLAAVYPTPLVVVLLCFGVIFYALKHFVCGWIHNFTAYAMVADNIQVTFREDQ